MGRRLPKAKISRMRRWFAPPLFKFPSTRVMSRAVSSRELIWLVPFLCVALFVVALLRSPPQFSASADSRVVTDGLGTPVRLGDPFRGAIFTWGPGIFSSSFLESARAPELLARAGDPEDRKDFAGEIWGRIYPSVLHDDRLWDLGGIGSRSPYVEVERMLAIDAGAYFGYSLEAGGARLLRQVGLPTLYFKIEDNWDDYLKGAARLMTNVSGDPQRGEALIAENREAYAKLNEELGVVAEDQQPRVLMLGTEAPYYIKTVGNSYQIYLVATQVKNASEGLAGQRQDAERILAMDPDFIFLMAQGKSPAAFMADPLWRGLKAVREKRVYRMLGDSGGSLMGLTYQPVSVRWMAEIVYPERLKPKVRQQLRDLYSPRFGYHMSDAEIDADLHLDVNSGSAGYSRFANPAATSKATP